MTRITAAITTYNRAHLVVEAVESALAQTYGDMEVVVVDDGSTDGTHEALSAFGDRIRYVWQENAGRAGARNRAIREATGDYIAFLDADDRWSAGKLERQAVVLDQHPDVVLVHGHVDVIGELGEPLDAETRRHRAIFTRAHRRGTSYAAYALECRCFTSTVLVRREALERVGGYDPAIAVEDVDLYLRLTLVGRIVFLEGSPVAAYRLHADQTHNDERTRGHVDLSLKHLRLLDSGIDVPDARIARRNLLLELARCRYTEGDRPATRRAVRSAVRVDPRALVVAPALKWLLLSLLPRAVRQRGARVRDRMAGAR